MKAVLRSLTVIVAAPAAYLSLWTVPVEPERWQTPAIREARVSKGIHQGDLLAQVADMGNDGIRDTGKGAPAFRP